MKKSTIIKVLLASSAAYIATGVAAVDYVTKKRKNKKETFTKNNPRIQEVLPWLDKQEIIDYEIKSLDGLNLKAKLIKANSNKVLIAVHGYHSYNFKEFALYLKFYHDLGFNILLPDNRAHGESEGDHIGFGWLDRLDIKEWIKKMKMVFNEDVKIVLHGISMGSATVLMTSGDNDLDECVKCIIADCGYTTLNDEFKYNLDKMKIPTHLILSSANLISQKRAGYKFKEASTLKQVSKSKTPTLFIHGDQDDFVPTYMVYELYNACKAPKDLLVIEGAGHAESFIVNQNLCRRTIIQFINKYL
jgi:hypothetical protein